MSSRLYLHCILCGRKQAGGLLSAAAWGRVELEGGRSLQACPGCCDRHADWEERLRMSVQAQSDEGFRHGSVFLR